MATKTDVEAAFRADLADVPVARHCWNRYCNGPEWWALSDESTDESIECPSCGYPCSKEYIPETIYYDILGDKY